MSDLLIMYRFGEISIRKGVSHNRGLNCIEFGKVLEFRILVWWEGIVRMEAVGIACRNPQARVEACSCRVSIGILLPPFPIALAFHFFSTEPKLRYWLKRAKSCRLPIFANHRHRHRRSSLSVFSVITLSRGATSPLRIPLNCVCLSINSRRILSIARRTRVGVKQEQQLPPVDKIYTEKPTIII